MSLQRRTIPWFRLKCCDVSIVSLPSAKNASKPWPRSPGRSRWPAGRQVFGEGDPADTLSLIVEGEIDIRYLLGSGEWRVVDTLIAGDILGWSALVEPHKMTGIATTRKPTRLIRIQAQPLRELCEHDPLLGLSAFDPGGPAAGRSLGRHPGAACRRPIEHSQQEREGNDHVGCAV